MGRLLGEAAVLARSRPLQQAFLAAGLHSVASSLLLLPSAEREAGGRGGEGSECAVRLKMQAQAARLLGNLSAHQPLSKAAVTRAGGLLSLIAAVERGLALGELSEWEEGGEGRGGGCVAEGGRSLLVEACYALANLASGVECAEEASNEASPLVPLLLRLLRMRGRPHPPREEGVEGEEKEELMRAEICSQAARALSNLCGGERLRGRAEERLHAKLSQEGAIEEATEARTYRPRRPLASSPPLRLPPLPLPHTNPLAYLPPSPPLAPLVA